MKKPNNDLKIKTVNKNSKKEVQEMLNGKLGKKQSAQNEDEADEAMMALNQSFISYLNRSKPKK